MAKKTIPPLHVALGYGRVTDADLVTQALAAHDGATVSKRTRSFFQMHPA